MQRIGHKDIEQLRRRLNLSIDRNGTSQPVRTAQQIPPHRKAVTDSHLDIKGRECEGQLGRFLLQERVYANESKHGRYPIERLRATSSQRINDVSNGEIQPVDPRRWVFLDTETTGLAGGTGTCAFLVGIGAIDDHGLRVNLYFMRDYDEESAMLAALAEELSRFDAVVTYNGKAFDIPLLETRYLLKRQRNPFSRMGHLDLLHCTRRLWRERMPNCRLGTLESDILGVERTGDIPGALIPQRYFEFLRSRRGAALAPVFHHNALDVVSLACLTARTMEIYANPGGTLQHGPDMLGLARWFRGSGEDGKALRLYRKAIHAGLAPTNLHNCLWETAQLERRIGNHDAKVELLRELAQVSPRHRAEALEALAKHYEHIDRDFMQALDLTRAAQRHAPSADLDHREARLLRRIAK